MHRYRRPIFLAVLVAACVAGLVAFDRDRQRRAEAIEWAMARMPLGISGAEAERRIGRPPDATGQSTGVIAYSAMMLSASNALAAEHGEPATYESRVWQVGPVTAVVWTDGSGRVVLRTAQRPPRRPPVLDRVRRLLQRLL